ncbi:MAG: succinate dehydrogenase, cytochrome b556 subunit [Burkholderiaceae bacterium]
MKTRPVFLDLFRIGQPIGAIASILHRASGLLLVLALLVLAVLFEYSLASPEGFAAVRQILAGPLATLALIVLAWALAHHVLAGIRHILMDTGTGWRLAQARRSALAVIVTGLVCAVAAALALIF